MCDHQNDNNNGRNIHCNTKSHCFDPLKDMFQFVSRWSHSIKDSNDPNSGFYIFQTLWSAVGEYPNNPSFENPQENPKIQGERKSLSAVVLYLVVVIVADRQDSRSHALSYRRQKIDTYNHLYSTTTYN